MADLDYELKMIDVKDIRLDPDNPRFIFQTEQKGGALSEQEMERIILDDEETKSLMRALAQEGVKNPLWLMADKGKSNFVVIEGNRRITALRELARLRKDGRQIGIRIVEPSIVERVPANVYNKAITRREALLQRARLQTGKQPWGRFNEAAVAYKLHFEMFLDNEDIASELQISRSEVERRIQAYKRFRRFSEQTGVDKPSYFSAMAEMPKKVQEWVDQGSQNEKEYFDWIRGGKISSIATKGGLRELPLVLDDPEALKVLRKPASRLPDALRIVEEKRVEISMPLLKRLTYAENALRNLTIEDINNLKMDPKKRKVLEDLKKRIDDVLKKTSSD